MIQDEAEEFAQPASSLQSSSYPETKVETPVAKSRGEPADAVERRGNLAANNDVEESTHLASSLQPISSSQRKELKSRIKKARESPTRERVCSKSPKGLLTVPRYKTLLLFRHS